MFAVDWKGRDSVFKLLRFPPCTPSKVNNEHATIGAVAQALLSKDEMDKRPFQLDDYIKYALNNNPSAKCTVSRATEGGWDNTLAAENGEIIEYHIKPENLASILMIVSGFYSEKIRVSGVDVPRTEGYEEVCTDMGFLVQMLISPLMAKERKTGMFAAGKPLNTALGLLESIPKLIFGLYSPDQLTLADRQTLDKFCKFKDIRLAVREAEAKVEKLQWMLVNYKRSKDQIKLHLGLPDGETIEDFIENTPQEKQFLRLKLEWHESEKDKGGDTSLPFPPQLGQLIDNFTFQETDGLTPGDIAENSLEAKEFFKRKLGAGVFQRETELAGVKMLLYHQLFDYAAETTAEVVKDNSVWCPGPGKRFKVRSVQQLAHQKIMLPADPNTGNPGPASRIELSQVWKAHPNAPEIINWLDAVQANAVKTKDTFGFYLAIQPITRVTVNYWTDLLNFSTGTINEALGGIFSELPYIKEDLLFIIANAWMNREAMQGRDTFDGALGIRRNYSTLTADPMPAPPIPAPPIPSQGEDGEETDSESGNEEGSDDDDEAAAAADAAAADAAAADAAAAAAAADAAAAAAGFQQQNGKKRKGAPTPGPPQRIVDAVYKVAGDIKEKPKSMMPDVRIQIEKLLGPGQVDPDYWDDLLVTQDEDTALEGLKDKLGLPEMYIEAITTHRHKTTSVLAYYVTYLAAEALETPEKDRQCLMKAKLVARFGKPPAKKAQKA